MYNAEGRLRPEVYDWSANSRIANQSDGNSVKVSCCAIVWATIPSPSLLRGDGVRSVPVLDRSYRNGRARASRLLVSTGWSPASATEDNQLPPRRLAPNEEWESRPATAAAPIENAWPKFLPVRESWNTSR